MAVIMISRGSYSMGGEVAEKVAQKIGYDCLSREVLLEASKDYNIPEVKLIHAYENAPSILDRFSHGKKKYIAYMQAALLKHLMKDNIVYHGLAGHFFVRHIPHALKVRIVTEMESRVKIVMERDKISREQALRFINKLDGQRRKWSLQLHGIDLWDPILYDLVLQIDKITADDAVDTICQIVSLKQFQTTPESKRAMGDLALSTEVKAVLMDVKPNIEVCAENGLIYVQTEAPVTPGADWMHKIEEIAKTIPEVKEIRVISKDVPTSSYPYASTQDRESPRDLMDTYFTELG